MLDINKETRILQEIAVIIPTYKARNHILGVINQICPEVALIYVVDDCCPDAVIPPHLSKYFGSGIFC
jgi:hypothetical protein